jgi:hypothetical protein
MTHKLVGPTPWKRFVSIFEKWAELHHRELEVWITNLPFLRNWTFVVVHDRDPRSPQRKPRAF